MLAVVIIAATFSSCGAAEKVTPQVSTNATTTAEKQTTTTEIETETTTAPEESETEETTTEKTAQMMESESEESATTTETTKPETAPVTEQEETQPVQSDIGNKIADSAVLQLDVPFAEGGTSPETGFDSSGFIYYIMKINGFDSFARGLNAQISEATQRVSYNELQRGDAVYFTTADDHSTAQFGGIYIGDGKMIFSSTNGTNTSIKDISSQFWRDCFVSAVRVS